MKSCVHKYSLNAAVTLSFTYYYKVKEHDTCSY